MLGHLEIDPEGPHDPPWTVEPVERERDFWAESSRWTNLLSQTISRGESDEVGAWLYAEQFVFMYMTGSASAMLLAVFCCAQTPQAMNPGTKHSCGC